MTLTPFQGTHDGRNPINVTVAVDRLSEAFIFKLQDQVTAVGPGAFRALSVWQTSPFTYVVSLFPNPNLPPAAITIYAGLNAMGLSLPSPSVILPYGATHVHAHVACCMHACACT